MTFYSPEIFPPANTSPLRKPANYFLKTRKGVLRSELPPSPYFRLKSKGAFEADNKLPKGSLPFIQRNVHTNANDKIPFCLFLLFRAFPFTRYIASRGMLQGVSLFSFLAQLSTPFHNRTGTFQFFYTKAVKIPLRHFSSTKNNTFQRVSC